MMKVREIPLVFDCEGSDLVGMAHVPEAVRSRGLVFILAGAAQYRGGMCRMQVQMAREWAAQGVPVMRFDHRGLGDSPGTFRGFGGIGADIGAAVEIFLKQVPGMTEVVLWGGCDAASATMINAWKYPAVTGIVLGNAWVHSEKTSDTAAIQHFSQRLRHKDFWLKVLRLQYNPLPAIATIGRRAMAVLKKVLGLRTVGSRAPFKDDPSLDPLLRMRNGLRRFKGDVLLLMSGRSLVSTEFDLLVADDPAWQQALQDRRRLARYDLLNADQALSSIADRAEAARVTACWMMDPAADLGAAMTNACPRSEGG